MPLRAAQGGQRPFVQDSPRTTGRLLYRTETLWVSGFETGYDLNGSPSGTDGRAGRARVSATERIDGVGS
jgi:hypothetical protein